MKHILITGGAGFIGSHLARALLAQKNHVILVDNLYTGDKRNISDLLEDHNCQFIEHDITEPFAPQNPPPLDRIYNLACPASPVHYQRDPIQTLFIGVMGAYHMLELARKTGARILQASTSEVYGD